MAIMTEKVLEDFGRSSKEVAETLKKSFGDNLIYLPWEKADKMGHTDSIVHSLGNGRLLVNLNLYSKDIAVEMRKRLEEHFTLIDLKLSSYHKYSWAYINMIQTRDVIIVPGLGLPTDVEALEQIKSLHPEYEDRIYQVNIGRIVRKWDGALNCLSWTISREYSKIPRTEQMKKRYSEIYRKALIYEGNLRAMHYPQEQPFDYTDEELIFLGNYSPLTLRSRFPNLNERFWKLK